MLTLKERPLVKFFQYTGIFSASRGSPRATNYSISISEIEKLEGFSKIFGRGEKLLEGILKVWRGFEKFGGI